MFALLFAVVVQGCKKEEDPPCPAVEFSVPATEVEAIRTYLSANSITATEDSRGFFYRIVTPGTGAKPNACSDVLVNYVGRLTTGGIFDQQVNAGFNLGSLIKGWRLGLPHIGAGGSMVLYLPPSLGYGYNNVGTIPGGSILIFTIDLKEVI